MKLELDSETMFIAMVSMLTGILAAVTVVQLELLKMSTDQSLLNQSAYMQYKPTQRVQPPVETTVQKQIEESVVHTEPDAIEEEESVEETIPRAVELEPMVYLGYNTSDDLVAVAKKLPDGTVKRRVIRDPNMSTSELRVDRWVEYLESIAPMHGY
jgi:hypothetical protein